MLRSLRPTLSPSSLTRTHRFRLPRAPRTATAPGDRLHHRLRLLGRATASRSFRSTRASAWLFPDVIDEPLHSVNLNLKWFLEPWVAG